MLSRVLCNFYRLPWLHGTMTCLVLYQYILLCFPIALQPFAAPQLSILGSREPNCAVFIAFAEGVFFCLPRSYRGAEKSDPIGSREPNFAVFQQNPTVVTTDLDAPMDPEAVIAQA